METKSFFQQANIENVLLCFSMKTITVLVIIVWYAGEENAIIIYPFQRKQIVMMGICGWQTRQLFPD